MYCCQKTTQYPVNSTRNHMNRLIPASTSSRSAVQIHQGTLNGYKNVAMRSSRAMPSTGRTRRWLPTTTQKFLATVEIDGGGASPAWGGSREKNKTTNNMAKKLSGATRETFSTPRCRWAQEAK